MALSLLLLSVSTSRFCLRKTYSVEFRKCETRADLDKKILSPRVSYTKCNLLGKNRLGVCKTPISLTRNRASCGPYHLSRRDISSKATGGAPLHRL